jgi:hypothetical protein
MATGLLSAQRWRRQERRSAKDGESAIRIRRFVLGRLWGRNEEDPPKGTPNPPEWSSSVEASYHPLSGRNSHDWLVSLRRLAPPGAAIDQESGITLPVLRKCTAGSHPGIQSRERLMRVLS